MPGAATGGGSQLASAPPRIASLFRQRPAPLLRVALGLAVLAFTGYLAFAFSGQVADAADALSEANFAWLPPAIATEAIAYAFIAFGLRRLLVPPVSASVAYRISLVSSGLGSILPGSPAPGMALSVIELHRRGVSRARAALALAWMNWFSARALVAIAAIVAALATFEGDLPRRHGIVPGALGVIVILVLTAALVSRRATAERAAVMVMRLKFWGARASTERAREIGGRWHESAVSALGSGANQRIVSWANAASWLTDAACLWLLLRAVGVHADATILLLAYCTGLILSALPFLPGGLGVVETSVTAVLHYYKIPLDAALAGVLAWRAIGLFLPALAGLVALASLRGLPASWRGRLSRAPVGR